jgi:hypothetical protein
MEAQQDAGDDVMSLSHMVLGAFSSLIPLSVD